MLDDAGFQRVMNAFGLTPKPDAPSPEGSVPNGPSQDQQDIGPTAKDWKEHYADEGLRRDMIADGRPGMATSANSTLDPEYNGKTPAIPNARGELIGDAEWNKRESFPLPLAKRCAHYKLNIGVRTKEINACDIDTDSKEVADAIDGLAVVHLGLGPVREREGSSKRLIPYHSKRGSMRKCRMEWKDKDGNVHLVEWLADGQQFVCEGIHPSGKLYVWRHGENLIKWGLENLTEVEGHERTIGDVSGRAWSGRTGQIL